MSRGGDYRGDHLLLLQGHQRLPAAPEEQGADSMRSAQRMVVCNCTWYRGLLTEIFIRSLNFGLIVISYASIFRQIVKCINPICLARLQQPGDSLLLVVCCLRMLFHIMYPVSDAYNLAPAVTTL